MSLARAAMSIDAEDCNAVKTLIVSYIAWKALLLLIAAASPGPGYDTSTLLLLDGDSASSWLAKRLASKLIRWDAFYYVTTATRGHLYEQEWAFGWGMKKLLRGVTALLPFRSSLVSHATVGICISHITHLASTLLLYALTNAILPRGDRARKVAHSAALLSIVSPAGMFLSAPYAEAPFATVQFAGMLACAMAWKPGIPLSHQSLLTVMAGGCFGLACTLRSNGLFSGLLFVEPFLAASRELLRRRSMRALGQVSVLGCAGLLTLGGMFWPQYIAWREYCTVQTPRPWCSQFPPSIYTWVQSHYWGVGFLKYWTISNVPLFFVAAPMLVVLISTAVMALDARAMLAIPGPGRSSQHATLCLRRLALPQLVVAVLATTSFHVQIVNRISSGYPVWYMVLALALHGTPFPGLSTLRLEWLVRAMVMYAVIQGGLYASFLPPA